MQWSVKLGKHKWDGCVALDQSVLVLMWLAAKPSAAHDVVATWSTSPNCILSSLCNNTAFTQPPIIVCLSQGRGGGAAAHDVAAAGGRARARPAGVVRPRGIGALSAAQRRRRPRGEPDISANTARIG